MEVNIWMLPPAGTPPNSSAAGRCIADDGPTADTFDIHYRTNLRYDVDVVNQPSSRIDDFQLILIDVLANTYQ